MANDRQGDDKSDGLRHFRRPRRLKLNSLEDVEEVLEDIEYALSPENQNRRMSDAVKDSLAPIEAKISHIERSLENLEETIYQGNKNSGTPSVLAWQKSQDDLIGELKSSVKEILSEQERKDKTRANSIRILIIILSFLGVLGAEFVNFIIERASGLIRLLGLI